MALAKSPSQLSQDYAAAGGGGGGWGGGGGGGGGSGGGGGGGGGGGNTAAARAVLSQLARLCGLTDGGDDEGGRALHVSLATSYDAR